MAWTIQKSNSLFQTTVQEDIKLLNCDYCKKVFKTKESLKDHISTVHVRQHQSKCSIYNYRDVSRVWTKRKRLAKKIATKASNGHIQDFFIYRAQTVEFMIDSQMLDKSIFFWFMV